MNWLVKSETLHIIPWSFLSFWRDNSKSRQVILYELLRVFVYKCIHKYFALALGFMKPFSGQNSLFSKHIWVYVSVWRRKSSLTPQHKQEMIDENTKMTCHLSMASKNLIFLCKHWILSCFLSRNVWKMKNLFGVPNGKWRFIESRMNSWLLIKISSSHLV